MDSCSERGKKAVKHVISFDEERIVYVAGTTGRSGLSLQKWASKGLPPGAIANGRIVDQEAFLPLLESLVQEQHLQKKAVIAVLPSRNAMFRELSLPAVEREKELREMVINEMLYYYSGMEGYTIDYMQSDRRSQEDKCYILAFALRNSCLEEYLAILEKAGLGCAGIDISSNCAGKLLHTCYPELPTAMMLQINQNSIDFRLVEDAFCVLSRNVGLSIARFQETEALDILVDEIADHISKIIQFQHARQKDDTAARLFLLGNFPEQEQFLAMLTQGLDLHCSFLDLLGYVKVKGGAPVDIHDYSKAMGALVRRK